MLRQPPEVKPLTEKKIPGLMCATEENDYQILADERYLYFVKLGKAGCGGLAGD